MKNKKSLLGLGLLALVLVLGVGYAAISGIDLIIDGTATAGTGDTDLKVSFTGDVTPTNATSGKVEGSASGLAGTINVTDLKLNETVTMEYELQNEETDVDAIVTLAETNGVVNTNENNFSVTTSLDDDAELEIPAGETATVTVSVTLTQTPITDNDEAADITINLRAEPDTQ